MRLKTLTQTIQSALDIVDIIIHAITTKSDDEIESQKTKMIQNLSPLTLFDELKGNKQPEKKRSADGYVFTNRKLTFFDVKYCNLYNIFNLCNLYDLYKS